MKPFVLDLSVEDDRQRIPILTVANAMKMKSGMVILHRGEEVGTHSTGEMEEMILVLEGKATVQIDGKVFSEVPAGSVAYIPSGTSHNVINRENASLHYVYILS